MVAPLAGKELELLRYLIDRRGRPVSRDELLEAVWEYQPGVSSRTVDVHVAWLDKSWKTCRRTPATYRRFAAWAIVSHRRAGFQPGILL